MTQDRTLEAVVDEVASLLNARIGLRADLTLRGRLRRCIRDEAAADGRDPHAYVSTLLAQEGALQRLLNRVTVQETAFFRHPEHFEVLVGHVLPTLPRPVRIWSAGCANGQEAYSLAMVLDEQNVAGSVIATDLSTAALDRTATARYTTRELTGLSPQRIARYLTGSGTSMQINEAIRIRVVPVLHNLVDSLPEQVRACQVVFCRNVLIYFSAEHARAFLDQVADALPGDGYLFLGSAETVWRLSDRFDTVRVDNTFIYRSRRAHRTGSAPTRAVPVQPARIITPATIARPAPAPAPELDLAESARQLARAGQHSLDAGDYQPAIVAFRKWAYLAPEEAMAHLHLGLALEAAGDYPSAKRAFGAARRAVLRTDRAHIERAIGGYSAHELLRLLDTKHPDVTP